MSERTIIRLTADALEESEDMVPATVNRIGGVETLRKVVRKEQEVVEDSQVRGQHKRRG